MPVQEPEPRLSMPAEAGGPTSHGLVRAIRRWDLVAIVINGVIGAGIFGLPSKVFASTGVWSLVAFAACAIVVMLVILCFAEVSSRFTGTGGPYLYTREAFGPFAAFEVGWLLWITRMTAFAANCNLLVDYLAWFVPGVDSPVGRDVAITSVVVALLAVNLIGVRQAATTGNFFAVSKMVPLALFVAVGVFAIVPGRLGFGPLPGVRELSASVLVLVYAFTGFEIATIPGGESKDPRRDMPRALLLSIAAVTVIYILVQIVAIGTLPGLALSKKPLADAAAGFLGVAGGAIIAAGAIVSIGGNLNANMLVAPRLPFAMAERGELPRFFQKTHARFRTPHVALLITAGVMLALTLSGTFTYALTISVIARLLTYAATCSALLVLRRRQAAPPALFRAPAGAIVAALALALIAWLLAQAKLEELRDTGIAVAVGLALYGVARLQRKET